MSSCQCHYTHTGHVLRSFVNSQINYSQNFELQSKRYLQNHWQDIKNTLYKDYNSKIVSKL